MTLQEKIQAAEAGDVNAMLALGNYYYVEEDVTEATKWYEKAAEQGNLIGMENASVAAAKSAMQSQMMKSYTEAYNLWMKAAIRAGEARIVYASMKAKGYLDSQTLKSRYETCNSCYAKAVYGATSIAYAVQKDYKMAYSFLKNIDDMSPDNEDYLNTRIHLLKGNCLYQIALAGDKDSFAITMSNAYIELANMVMDSNYIKDKGKTLIDEIIFTEAVINLSEILKNGIRGKVDAKRKEAIDLLDICIEYASNDDCKSILIEQLKQVCG